MILNRFDWNSSFRSVPPALAGPQRKPEHKAGQAQRPRDAVTKRNRESDHCHEKSPHGRFCSEGISPVRSKSTSRNARRDRGKQSRNTSSELAKSLTLLSLQVFLLAPNQSKNTGCTAYYT